jgi:transaldolase
MSKLNELAAIGQSVWLDYISREILEDGTLKNYISIGVRGVTSNPTIFEKAINGSRDYDEEMKQLISYDRSVREIYDSLVLKDIATAADLFLPLYEQTSGMDGYVSIEVDPTLANNTDGTVREARTLFAELDRPNIMIKVPATPAGIPAIETLISEGINVNVTLMFSMAHFESVVEAYISGLEKYHEKGGDLSGVASVASFFVSRVDVAIDKMLEEVSNKELQSKIAIANSSLVYAKFLEIIGESRWQELEKEGARIQRLLWASTGTKNPEYSDTLYVDALIGDHTVNTLPPDTLDAFMRSGTVASTIMSELDSARAYLAALENLGIDLNKVTEQLQLEGVDKFIHSFETLMEAIQRKKGRL